MTSSLWSPLIASSVRNYGSSRSPTLRAPCSVNRAGLWKPYSDGCSPSREGLPCRAVVGPTEIGRQLCNRLPVRRKDARSEDRRQVVPVTQRREVSDAWVADVGNAGPGSEACSRSGKRG